MGDVYERGKDGEGMPWMPWIHPSSPPMSRSQWVSVARTIPKFTASAAAVEPWPVPMSRAVLKAKRSDRKRSTMSSTVEDLPPQKNGGFFVPHEDAGFDSQQFWGIAPKILQGLTRIGNLEIFL